MIIVHKTSLHQPTVSAHIGGHDGGKSALDAFFGHGERLLSESSAGVIVLGPWSGVYLTELPKWVTNGHRTTWCSLQKSCRSPLFEPQARTYPLKPRMAAPPISRPWQPPPGESDLQSPPEAVSRCENRSRASPAARLPRRPSKPCSSRRRDRAVVRLHAHVCAASHAN